MSQTQQTAQIDLKQITQNLACMRRDKNYLEVRQCAIRRTLRNLEQQFSVSDDVDEAEELQDIIDNLCSISSDLETYRSHLEAELNKVTRGIQTLTTLRGRSGKQALAAYVIEDTELSMQNLARVRVYYDQVIETLQKIKTDPLG